MFATFCFDPLFELVWGFLYAEREGPCPNHLVVFSNGHIFSMRPFDDNGQIIPAQEIYRQLCYIKKLSQSRGQAVGVLTADDRTSFAKAYKHLRSLDPVNGHHLDHIEQAVITVQLDDACPKTPSEVSQCYRLCKSRRISTSGTVVVPTLSLNYFMTMKIIYFVGSLILSDKQYESQINFI